MVSVRLNAYIEPDGVLRLNVPMDLSGQHVEVMVIVQPIPAPALDAMGYPVGYFERTYGSTADDPIERGEQPHFSHD